MSQEHILLYAIPLTFLLILIGTAAGGYFTRDRRMVYVMPLAHLLVCVAVQLADWAWLPVFVIEFPMGVFLLALAWRYEHPLFWCGVLGTLWWYLLSRLLFAFLRKSK